MGITFIILLHCIIILPVCDVINFEINHGGGSCVKKMSCLPILANFCFKLKDLIK